MDPVISAAQETASVPTFSKEAIDQFARKFEALFYKGDATAMASYYTEDARLVADGIDPIQGRSGIEAFWQATCQRGKSLKMKRTIHVDEIQASDDIGYAVSTVTIQVQIPNGPSVTRTSTDLTVWRRQAEGTWRIEVDISNPNPQAIEQTR